MNQTNFWNDAAKYGAVIGGASAVCSLLGDATGAGFFGLIGLALYIGLLLYYTRKRATSRSTREEEYGYGRRLGFIVAMALFVGVINAAYTILASASSSRTNMPNSTNNRSRFSRKRGCIPAK